MNWRLGFYLLFVLGTLADNSLTWLLLTQFSEHTYEMNPLGRLEMYLLGEAGGMIFNSLVTILVFYIIYVGSRRPSTAILFGRPMPETLTYILIVAAAIRLAATINNALVLDYIIHNT